MTLSSKLEAWINKQEVPNGIENYSRDGELSDFCPLCDLEHDKIPFSSSANELEQNTRTFICKECSNAIQNSLVKGSIELDFSKERDKRANLLDYIANKNIPENKFLYLRDGGKYKDCIFCDSPIIGVGWPMELPAGESLTVYGGEVQVCDKCYDYLTSRNITLSHHIKNTDKCYDCNHEYPIMLHEFEMRSKLNNLGRHLCPECFYNKKEVIWGASLQRAINCEVCHKELRDDLTLVHMNPCYLHLPKIYCEICSLVSHDPDNEIIIKHILPNVYIVLDPIKPAYFIYQIIQKNRLVKEPQIVVYRDDFEKNTPLDKIAYLASERAHELGEIGKIILPDKQKKLLF